MFDRILRGMIQGTLPDRNIATLDRLALPLYQVAANQRVTLTRPNANRAAEPLDVTYIGSSQRGVVITGLLDRGVYRVRGYAARQSPLRADTLERPVWELPLVVSGNAEESDLTPVDRKQLDALRESEDLSFVAPGEEVSLAAQAILGQNSWWWLALAVLMLLLTETSVLASWSRHSGLPNPR